MIWPAEPQPLMMPLAVEAPFLVPKSMAAVPAMSESGMKTRKPMANMPAPIASRVGGRNRKVAITPARQNKAITQMGIRLDLNRRSEINPPTNVPAGPANSNMLLMKPELAVPVPRRSLIYTGDQ